MSSTAILLVLFPFLGSLVLGIAALLNRKITERFAGPVACSMIGVAFLQAVRLGSAHLGGVAESPTVADLGAWISTGNIHLALALRVDALSAVMALVVSGVSFLIHVYSLGYMAHDLSRTRYFAYLNLFCGFMLLLVTGASLPVLFIGWEGVGLSSYLLIGFWYSDVEKARAGRKAFIVNRIGDAGFLLGMILLFHVAGTFDMAELSSSSHLAAAEHGTLELAALLLFVGCVGKSAQFPLYIWLPDAMAGPTPVSALIHAATMVTAGVYLLARMSFLYSMAPTASHIVAATGAFTAFLAAWMALIQRDIKKVLAFSTVSQLGFMVLAMGVGAYGYGIFHLTTHAYFKALLFLAAGSVIHTLNGEQDIFRMGGLKNYVVGTTVTFFIGYLAIIGMWPFSGCFSKDGILYAAYASRETLLFWLALVTALLTVIYMTRLFCLVFLGVPRIPKQNLQTLRESPHSMLLPMGVLALLSFLGGMPPISFGGVLRDIFSMKEPAVASLMSEGKLSFWITVAVFATAVLTFKAYTSWSAGIDRLAHFTRRGRLLLERQLRFDDLVVGLGRKICMGLTFLARLIDAFVIDWTVNWMGRTTMGMGGAMARLQTGRTQGYALLILLGTILLSWFFLAGGL